MKFLLLSVSLLLFAFSFAQKTYRVGNVFWEYTKPTTYKTRIDNFLSVIRAGDSLITKNNNLEKQSNDNTILFSVAKSVSADLNVVLGSYQGNTNITRYSLKGYVDKLVDLMRTNYEKLGSVAKIANSETLISGVRFCVIESKIHHPEKNFTYWTRLYIAEVGGKELNIAVAYDNESDRKAIEKSIVSSKFHR